MFHKAERYQVFCRYCQRKYEADSLAEAVREVDKHEAKRKDGQCPKEDSPGGVR